MSRRSEVELSTLPEVAALATELTVIFKSLGISQQQYAVRTNYDKSYVSRFLNGRRVATQEFIDRLLAEVESHRKAPVTDQTRARLRQMRESALRVYDPDLHRLETLRNEVRKNQQEVRRLLLHQEALEGLLERRQAEADASRRELAQFESEWIAERIRREAENLAIKGEYEKIREEKNALREEVVRLQEELRITVAQKEAAEQRCAILEERVATTEVEVAEKLERDGIDDVGVPLQYLQDRLRQATDDEINRELVEFAFSRSSDDVARLALWLLAQISEDYAAQLVSDYCRQRPVQSSYELVRSLEECEGVSNPRPHFTTLANHVSTTIRRRSLVEVFTFFWLYSTAHRSESRKRKIIALEKVASRWIAQYPHQKSAPRRFGQFIEYLHELDEREAAVNLVRMVASPTGQGLRYGAVICLPEYEVEMRMFAREWVRKTGPAETQVNQITYQLGVALKNTSIRMLDFILAEMCARYSPANLADIYTDLFRGTHAIELAPYLAKALAEHDVLRDVRNHIEREQMAELENGKTTIRPYFGAKRMLDILNEAESGV
ncbi:helix-turn-helix domain-containing protein [Streptomyces sp. YIM B13508]|uniref:helix-turn-helix domain-containing protein n=1 Tax=Streptomyces sp. YIM B13508 TaxID=3366315 RepID=UPI00369AB60E